MASVPRLLATPGGKDPTALDPQRPQKWREFRVFGSAQEGEAGGGGRGGGSKQQCSTQNEYPTEGWEQ
eukprot:4568157-Lingulodinium_polyedra.AAC.1